MKKYVEMVEQKVASPKVTHCLQKCVTLFLCAILYLTVAPCSIIPIYISTSEFFTVFYTSHVKHQLLSCTFWI